MKYRSAHWRHGPSAPKPAPGPGRASPMIQRPGPQPRSRYATSSSSDCPLHDFQAGAPAQHDPALAEIGAELARLEPAEPHRPRCRPLAAHRPFPEVDLNVAGLQPIAVRPDHPHRADDVDQMRVEVVAALVGGDRHWSLGEAQPGQHPLDVDDRLIGPLLDGAPGADLELVALIVFARRSEEHTSELQSQSNLVCRLLLEKKNTK